MKRITKYYEEYWEDRISDIIQKREPAEVVIKLPNNVKMEYVGIFARRKLIRDENSLSYANAIKKINDVARKYGLSVEIKVVPIVHKDFRIMDCRNEAIFTITESDINRYYFNQKEEEKRKRLKKEKEISDQIEKSLKLKDEIVRKSGDWYAKLMDNPFCIEMKEKGFNYWTIGYDQSGYIEITSNMVRFRDIPNRDWTPTHAEFDFRKNQYKPFTDKRQMYALAVVLLEKLYSLVEESNTNKEKRGEGEPLCALIWELEESYLKPDMVAIRWFLKEYGKAHLNENGLNEW